MKRAWSSTSHWVATAPLTYLWLTALLVTTVVAHQLAGPRLDALLRARSTNLYHLVVDPERVLFSSLLWIDGRYWWPYLIAFSVFLAPAERWLGHLRWLIVGLVCHVGATYLSEGYVLWRIRTDDAPARLADVRDVGVSYFLVGIIGVLVFRVPPRWRWVYLASAVLVFGGAFALSPGFTALGHLCALALGIACYPLTRGRQAPVAA